MTLATHGGAAKLERFLVQLEYWRGPASLAVYINDGDTQISELVHFVSNHTQALQNTSIHVMMEHTRRRQALLYPHNPLRNLALDYSADDYVLITDVDLIPGPRDCHSMLLKTMKRNDGEIMREMVERKVIFVLPAFDIFPKEGQDLATPDQLPDSKGAVVEAMRQEKGEPFRYTRWNAGHGATNFTRWYDYYWPNATMPTTPKPATTATSLKPNTTETTKSAATTTTAPLPILPRKMTATDESFYMIQYEYSFEPYVLAYRPGVPRYWNGFRGYGYNKLSWFMEAHRAGYQFATLMDAYMIHLAHPSTKNREQLTSNNYEKDTFIGYLDTRFCRL